MPALNTFMSGIEIGKETVVPDKGFGKSKMLINEVQGKSNMLQIISMPEKYERYEMLATYCPEGMKLVCRLNHYMYN